MVLCLSGSCGTVFVRELEDCDCDCLGAVGMRLSGSCGTVVVREMWDFQEAVGL